MPSVSFYIFLLIHLVPIDNTEMYVNFFNSTFFFNIILIFIIAVTITCLTIIWHRIVKVVNDYEENVDAFRAREITCLIAVFHMNIFFLLFTEVTLWGEQQNIDDTIKD